MSLDFLPLFFAQKTLPGTHMTRLKRFHEIFRFREDIRLQRSKISCLGIHDYADTSLSRSRFCMFIRVPGRVYSIDKKKLYWISNQKVFFCYLRQETCWNCSCDPVAEPADRHDGGHLRQDSRDQERVDETGQAPNQTKRIGLFGRLLLLLFFKWKCCTQLFVRPPCYKCYYAWYCTQY